MASTSSENLLTEKANGEKEVKYRITESLELEGTFRDHLVQPPKYRKIQEILEQPK